MNMRRICGVLVAVSVFAIGTPAHAAFVDSYIHTLNATSPGLGALNVGQSVQGLGLNDPNLGPVAAIPGPVTSATFQGQFAVAGWAPGTMLTPADAATSYDVRYGILQISNATTGPINVTGQFLSNGGFNWFSEAIDDGFSSVNVGTTSTDRDLHFSFDIGAAGIQMDPGFDYILFAALGFGGNLSSLTVPNDQNAKNQLYEISAVALGPDQLGEPNPQQWQLFGFPPISVQNLAMSRVIPVVPEPGTMLLLAIGAGALLRRSGKAELSRT